MIFRMCVIILLLSSSITAWNPIYKENCLTEVIEKQSLNDSPHQENNTMYYSGCIGSVLGVLITSGFFFWAAKYYKTSKRDSNSREDQLTVSLAEEPRKEAYPSNPDSETTGSSQLIANTEPVSSVDVSIDLPLDSDPIGDNEQLTPLPGSDSKETTPASHPTEKETETDRKSRSFPNSPRDANRPGKSNEGENKRLRSPSLARRQAKKESHPSSMADEPVAATDHCDCKSKLALETLEKELEELRKSVSNAERMKRDSTRTMIAIKKEMAAMGSTLKEMEKEKDKLREAIETLKKEKKEAIKVADARWSKKLEQLQETKKIDTRRGLCKSDLSSGTRESASSKSDSSPGKADLTPRRRGIAWDKARLANEKARKRDSSTTSRPTKTSTRNITPVPTMILPAFFDRPEEKAKIKCAARCEISRIDKSIEENKSGDIDESRNDGDDVGRYDRREKCQDVGRDNTSKGNDDDDKSSDSHTAVSKDIQDIKPDKIPSISDRKVPDMAEREEEEIRETIKMQEYDLKGENSKVKLNGKTGELLGENCRTRDDKYVSSLDKSATELSDDFEFDFGEDDLKGNDFTESDYARVLSSQNSSTLKTGMDNEINEQTNEDIIEEEIEVMSISGNREQHTREETKVEEACATSKLENVKSNVEDSDGKSEQSPIPPTEKKTSLEIELSQEKRDANATVNVKKGAIPTPISQQKYQRNMSSKSHSVCKDSQRDSEHYVKSSASAVIPLRKSATAVATELMRNKSNAPINKSGRQRKDSSLVRNLLTRPSSLGCRVGDKESSSFVAVTKNVCVLKTWEADDRSSSYEEKKNELISDGIKSCTDSDCGATTESEIAELKGACETNRRPLSEMFDTEDSFCVKFVEGSKRELPPTPSNVRKLATKTENEPDPMRLEEREAARQKQAEKSHGGDSVLNPDTMGKNPSEPKTMEVTNDLEKYKNLTKEAERCMQNIIGQGPSFTEEDQAKLELLIDRIHPEDDLLKLVSFNEKLESSMNSLDSERKHSLIQAEKSNSERVNAAQGSERQSMAMSSSSGGTCEGKYDGGTTKGLAEKLSRYFVYDPQILAENFHMHVKDSSGEKEQ